MEFDHRVLGVVPSNRIDASINELVIKCQLVAIGGLEKQVETLKSKLKDCDEEAITAFRFYSLAMSAIEFIILLLVVYYAPPSKYLVFLSLCKIGMGVASLIALVKLKTYSPTMSSIGSMILFQVIAYSGAPSSEYYVVLLSLCGVALVVASLVALVKLKTGHNHVSVIRAQMNYLRASIVILQRLVEEDFRANEGARCFVSYYHRGSRILGLFRHMREYHYYEYISPELWLDHGCTACMRTVILWACLSILAIEVRFS